VLTGDDEGPVRRAAVQILLRIGYDVIEAGDGEEAVRVFNENAYRGFRREALEQAGERSGRKSGHWGRPATRRE
jgi:CheY-like chemotaxis protein